MTTKRIRIFAWAGVCIFLLNIAGCASSGSDKQVVPEVKPIPIFPAQSAIQSGNYAAFRAENEEALKTCNDPEQCSIALFNLSFLYTYSKSPYYNPARGTLYLQDLIKGTPESPWAYHARVWLDIMKKKAKAEPRKRPHREETKQETSTSDTGKIAEAQQDTMLSAGLEDAREAALESMETERKRLEAEIQYRDDVIRELNNQIQRARQIDIEIEKKERGLLY